jgi:hypothetical protein
MTTFGASLRFDHAFLAVEQEQRIHCMLELTAPPIPQDRRRPPLASARAQDEARERAQRGDFDGARDVLKRAADDLRAIAPKSGRAEELLEQAEQTEQHGVAMELGTFNEFNAKAMRYESNLKRRGRRKGTE